jgi:hypothetical protein
MKAHDGFDWKRNHVTLAMMYNSVAGDGGMKKKTTAGVATFVEAVSDEDLNNVEDATLAHAIKLFPVRPKVQLTVNEDMSAEDKLFFAALFDAIHGDDSVKKKKATFKQLWEFTCRTFTASLSFHSDDTLERAWTAATRAATRAKKRANVKTQPTSSCATSTTNISIVSELPLAATSASAAATSPSVSPTAGPTTSPSVTPTATPAATVSAVSAATVSAAVSAANVSTYAAPLASTVDTADVCWTDANIQALLEKSRSLTGRRWNAVRNYAIEFLHPRFAHYTTEQIRLKLKRRKNSKQSKEVVLSAGVAQPGQVESAGCVEVSARPGHKRAAAAASSQASGQKSSKKTKTTTTATTHAQHKRAAQNQTDSQQPPKKSKTTTTTTTTKPPKQKCKHQLQKKKCFCAVVDNSQTTVNNFFGNGSSSSSK